VQRKNYTRKITLVTDDFDITTPQHNAA